MTSFKAGEHDGCYRCPSKSTHYVARTIEDSNPHTQRLEIERIILSGKASIARGTEDKKAYQTGWQTNLYGTGFSGPAKRTSTADPWGEGWGKFR